MSPTSRRDLTSDGEKQALAELSWVYSESQRLQALGNGEARADGWRPLCGSLFRISDCCCLGVLGARWRNLQRICDAHCHQMRLDLMSDEHL